MTLTQIELKKLLHYNENTGEFTWRVKPAKQIAIGSSAGHVAGKYVQIRVLGTLYYAHRLAYLYMVGTFPEVLIDHDNRNGHDNSWKNLKATTHAINSKNMLLSKKNTSGVIGVTWDKRNNKWMAKIQVDWVHKFLGYFDTVEAAAIARKRAEQHFNFHPNHGK